MKPKNLLIYYGYPNSFNSAANGWDNDKVAEDMANYSVIVLGDGIANTGHADYANTSAIVPKIKTLKQDVEIYGYVTVNQTYSAFKAEVDEWVALGAYGIFMDEAGYDFGTVATNGRDAFNDKVDYVHSKGMRCFVNAWNMDHVVTTNNDPSYPNTTWNPDTLPTELTKDDMFLLESLAVNTQSYTGNYEAKADWKARVDKAIDNNDKVRIAGSCVIDEGHTDAQTLFNFAYISALMTGTNVFGSSSHNYGAAGAVTLYNRLEIAELATLDGVIVNSAVDADIYYKYLEHGKLVLDFSPLSQIVVY